MGEDRARRLAEERAALRAAGEYTAADELRDRIAALGFRIEDRADGGFTLTPSPPSASPRVDVRDVPSVLAEAPTADWSVHWLHQGWPEDVLRGIHSVDAVAGERSLHHVVVEAVPAEEDAWPSEVEAIPLSEDPGFGAARNAGLIRSTGRLVMVADSVEASGDVLGPMEAALADPSVGVCGPFGVVTDDLRSFRASPGPDVDAVEGYLMAFRRSLLESGLAFDPKYRFFRAADVDLSFRIKEMGLRAVRVDVPVRRRPRRAWESTPPDRREALSRRNFYRFLDRFRGRTDLLVDGAG
jgi:hypothetical protein